MKVAKVVVVLALLALAGCNTVAGMGRDITGAANSLGG